MILLIVFGTFQVKKYYGKNPYVLCGCDESCVLSVGLFLRMLLGAGWGCRTYVVVAKQLVKTELCRLTSNNRKETSISGWQQDKHTSLSTTGFLLTTKLDFLVSTLQNIIWLLLNFSAYKINFVLLLLSLLSSHTTGWNFRSLKFWISRSKVQAE